MTRYFFKANYLGVMVADDIGEMFPTLRDAEAHAAIVARDLSRKHAVSCHRVCAQRERNCAHEHSGRDIPPGGHLGRASATRPRAAMMAWWPVVWVWPFGLRDHCLFFSLEARILASRFDSSHLAARCRMSQRSIGFAICLLLPAPNILPAGGY
jgi:Domain of unknown function (DUF6894)